MRRIDLVSILGLAIALTACDEPPPEPELDTTVMVGPLELAISALNDGPAPSNALHIDINQDLVRMEGVHIYELERGGRVPEAEIQNDALTVLRDRIRAAPSRSALALTVHGSVPYGTTVRVVAAALEAGYRNVSFAVRPPNAPSPTSTGWLPLSAPRVVGHGDDVTFVPARPWADFASHWQEVYEGCRAGAYVDCDGLPTAIAGGGDLEIVIFTRGNGMVMRFFQVNVPDAGPVSTGGPVLLDGLRAEAPGAGEEIPPTPATAGAFSFRFQEASAAENHISIAARPVCGPASCPIIVEADEETETMRVLSLLGSLVPNGAAAPNVVFRLPE